MTNVSSELSHLPDLLASARRSERLLRGQAVRFVARNIFDRRVRNTLHFREWFDVPMNYARIMELPLTLHLLQAKKDDRILDVSSPKLLSLYYALNGFERVVAADLEDYFIRDFEVFKKQAGLRLDTATFDAAKKIPYPDGHFERIFSVSVLEHIPDAGDTAAIQEMLRVLKPSGTIVVTLPAFPHYVEEWTSSNAYWKSVDNTDGKTFFQRRYDRKALEQRLPVPKGVAADVVLIAERPVAPPRVSSTGRMLHNSYYIGEVPTARLIKAIGRRMKILPFTTYCADLIVSKRSHYLTQDWNDPNIRQVVLRMTKTTEPPAPDP